MGMKVMGPDYSSLAVSYKTHFDDIQVRMEKEVDSMRFRLSAGGLRMSGRNLDQVAEGVRSKFDQELEDLRSGYYGEQLKLHYESSARAARPRNQVYAIVPGERQATERITNETGKAWDPNWEANVKDKYGDKAVFETVNTNPRTSIFESDVLKAQEFNETNFGGSLEDWEAFALTKYGGM